MNKSSFNKTGGYPLKAERLQELQTAYEIFNSLGALAGDLTIISGCKTIGTTVQNGYVFIDGELLEFRGTSVTGTSKVIIIEDAIKRAFKNGEIKQIHTIRYATFGTAETSWDWSDFTQVETLKSIQGRILPVGTNPQMYSGDIDNIPEGWQLCDGTNGTPNLKGMFIVGYNPDDDDYNEIGKTGGLKDVALKESEMPGHTHTGKTDPDGAHIVKIKIREDAFGSGTGPSLVQDTPENDEGYRTHFSEQVPDHSHSITLDSKGGDQAHENRPPYYTLAYIIYIG